VIAPFLLAMALGLTDSQMLRTISRASIESQGSWKIGEFDPTRPGGANAQVISLPRKDQATLAVTLRVYPSRRVLISSWRMNLMRQAIYVGPKVGFSGYGIGDDVMQGQNAHSCTIDCRYGSCLIQGDIEYNGWDRHPLSNAVQASDRRSVEAVVRLAVAMLGNLDSSDSQSGRLGNRPIASRTDANGESLFSLKETCHAFGGALDLNVHTQIAILKFHGHSVVIPLAAQGMKVDGKWVKTLGISQVHDGNWYVPKAPLETLLK
jgi:hypothetical protein